MKKLDRMDWRLAGISFLVTIGVACLVMLWISRPSALAQEGGGQPPQGSETPQCPDCQIWDGTQCVDGDSCPDCSP